jgi:hypothetical protein
MGNSKSITGFTNKSPTSLPMAEPVHVITDAVLFTDDNCDASQAYIYGTLNSESIIPPVDIRCEQNMSMQNKSCGHPWPESIIDAFGNIYSHSYSETVKFITSDVKLQYDDLHQLYRYAETEMKKNPSIERNNIRVLIGKRIYRDYPNKFHKSYTMLYKNGSFYDIQRNTSRVFVTESTSYDFENQEPSAPPMPTYDFENQEPSAPPMPTYECEDHKQHMHHIKDDNTFKSMEDWIIRSCSASTKNVIDKGLLDDENKLRKLIALVDECIAKTKHNKRRIIIRKQLVERLTLLLAKNVK